jgi:hypothetical protein
LPDRTQRYSKTSISIAERHAYAARCRADELRIDVAVYLRILLRNAQALQTPVPDRVPSQRGRHSRARLPLGLTKHDQIEILDRVYPLSLSAWVEHLVALDTADHSRPLIILPHHASSQEAR